MIYNGRLLFFIHTHSSGMYSIIFTLVFFSVHINGYPYNDLLDKHSGFKDVARFPDTCCQLEWTDVKQSDRLPDDYVEAGTFKGRKWAYQAMKHYSGYYNGRLAVKSDQPGEASNSLGNNGIKINRKKGEECAEGFQKRSKYGENERPRLFDENSFWCEKPLTIEPLLPILTNPNKCSLGWYRARFAEEQLPYNDDWFFPRMSGGVYGDYARFEDIPAKRGSVTYERWSMKQSESATSINVMSSLTDSVTKSPQNFDLLYVDCRKSILAMSTARLYNISYDQKAIEDLKLVPTKVVYTKKIMVNNSPVQSESEVKFAIETTDSASLVLKDSFSSHFSTDEHTYNEAGASVKLGLGGIGMLFGLEMGGGYKREWGKQTGKGATNSSEKSILKASARRELFEFSQKVTVPPFSKTTLIAFSKPIQGEVSFTATYELSPTGNTNVRVLEATLKKYGMDKKLERTDRGTLLVHYEGSMHIDAGHQVDVDIQTVKLGTAPAELFL